MTTMIKTLRTAIMGAAVLTLTACASNLTSSFDSAEAQRLDNFKTYAWLGGSFALGNTQSPEVANPINEGRIRSAINDELAQKGYRLVDREEADFIVSAAIGANNEVRIRNFYRSRGFRPFGRGFGSRFDRGIGNGPVVQNYKEGVLVLNVFENQSKEAIWHGAASKRLSKNFMAQELIDEAAAVLLEAFPNSATGGASMLDEGIIDQASDESSLDRMS